MLILYFHLLLLVFFVEQECLLLFEYRDLLNDVHDMKFLKLGFGWILFLLFGF